MFVGGNTRTEKLSIAAYRLEQSGEEGEYRHIKPTGFVFHESRVGSTLVANALASNPWNMVFSESDPPSGNDVDHLTF